MGRLLTFLSVLLIAHHVWADDVTVEQAREIAARFLNNRLSSGSGGVARAKRVMNENALRPAYVARKTPDAPADLYVFNQDDGKGFVIVAGTDAVPGSVLAYSDENSLVIDGNTPETVLFLLEGFQSGVQQMRRLDVKVASGESESSEVRPIVGPLLKVNYNQSEPFNASTPVVSGKHCTTGCVPTAAAQIMAYYHWPESGLGEHTSTWTTRQYGHFSESDYTDWSDSGVARLMADLGTAADTQYAISLTGTEEESLFRALRMYFRYSVNDMYRSDEHLKEVLDAGRPVYYCGKGNSPGSPRNIHSFVCDGYDSNDFFHFNFGWGGDYNGYYLTTWVRPGYDNFSGWFTAKVFIPDFSPAVEHERCVYRAVGDDEAELLACSEVRDLVIPSEVIIEGKVRKVTGINETAFQNAYVESLSLPGSIKSVRREWFRNYYGRIKSITLGEGTAEIGPKCFMSVPLLETITLPSTLEKIGSAAFDNLTKLTTVRGLENSRVTELGDSCFMYCSALRQINTSGIKYFGARSFYNCKELRFITLQDGAAIGDRAFIGCKNLDAYDLNIENLSSIGDYAFCNCHIFRNKLVFSQVKYVGVGAFDFTPIDGINVSSNDIREVVIPSCTEFIGACAFNISNLANIEVAEDNPDYVSIDGALFSKDRKTLCFVPCQNIQPINQSSGPGCYSVPEGVTHIMEGALAGHNYIHIPESVTMIDSTAFNSPYRIYCYSQTPPTYQKQNSLTCHTEIHMPYGCLDKYREAKGWRDSYYFKDDIYGGYPDASKVQMMKVYYHRSVWDGMAWVEKNLQKNIGFSEIRFEEDNIWSVFMGDNIRYEELDSIVLSGVFDGSNFRYLALEHWEDGKMVVESQVALKDIHKLVIENRVLKILDSKGNVIKGKNVDEYFECAFTTTDSYSDVFLCKYKYLSMYNEWIDAELSVPLTRYVAFHAEDDFVLFDTSFPDINMGKYLKELTVPKPRIDDYPVWGNILVSFRNGNQITIPRENFAQLTFKDGLANVIGYDGELQNSFDAKKLRNIILCDYDLTSYRNADWAGDNSPKMYVHSGNGYKEIPIAECDSVLSDGVALLIDDEEYGMSSIDSITFARPATAGKGVFQVSDMCREIVTPSYRIDFGAAIDLGEGKTVTVEPMRSDAMISRKNLRDVKSYEVSMSDGTHELGGVARIRIPLEMAEGYAPGAAWYNQDSARWESICSFYDGKAREVVILTDHLSEFSVFNVKRKDTRAEYIVLSDFDNFMLQNDISSQEAAKLLLELSNIDSWDTKGYRDWAAEKYGNASLWGLDIGYNLVKAAGYENVFLERFGDAIGRFGAAVSAFQILRNIEDGKDYDAAAGMLKLALDQGISYLCTIIGGSAMYATAASVAFINYALNKIGEEAWNGRKDLYRAAYSMYYHSREGYRSRPKWVEMIKPLFTTQNLSEDEMKEEIDRMVTEYSRKFWEDAGVIGYYLNEARNLKFTALGGMTESLQNEISNEGKAWVYQFSIAPAIKSINDEAMKMNWDECYKQIKRYTDILNEVMTLNLYDRTSTSEGSEFAGCIVRFQELPETILDPQNWQCRLDEDGNGQIQFRAFAQIANQIEPILEVYDPEEDRVVNAITFSLGYGPRSIDVSKGAEDYEPMAYIDDMELHVTTDPDTLKITTPMSGETLRHHYDGSYSKVFKQYDHYSYVYPGMFTDDIRECIMQSIPLLGRLPSGNIEIKSDGLTLTGTFSEKTGTGDGTFTLDCEKFFQYATAEEAKSWWISFYEGIDIVPDAWDDTDWIVHGNLLDGTVGHKITGNFTVEQVTPYRLSYTFMGSGTFTIDGNTLEIKDYVPEMSDYRKADACSNPWSISGTCDWKDTFQMKIVKEDR